MTSSTNPFEIIDDDDDDGFDWEAAVREIDDVACQATTTTTTTTTSSTNNSNSDPQVSNNYTTTLNGNDKRVFSGGGGGSSKQSTLDKFMIKACPKENPSRGNNGQQDIDNNNNASVVSTNVDERVCWLDIDPQAAKSWIYPVNVNVPRREYQFSITKTALFSNTLVALPTGLGKTFIAAVVMYNYFRWFPQGKIVFAAPSRPLVMQQIEACHNIVGIPQEWTIDMTGQMNPMRRASFWKEKRVFFVTPQVLERDIQSGTCMVKYLVCLVIDEAHRAMGNYSYCVAVRELMAVPVQLRILALSATPGSKQQTIQQIINNLHISTLEYRDESDDDVSPYVHNRKIEVMQVAMGQDAVDSNNMLLELIRPYAVRLSSMGLLQIRDFNTMTPCDLLNMREKFRQAPPPDLPHMKYGEVEGYFGVLITLYHIRKLLSSHGVKPAYEMLEEKLQQGSFARFMSRNEIIQKVRLLMQKSLSHGALTPKLSKMLEVLNDHFNTKDPQSSRVIIFSNFRGSVRDIMDALVDSGDHVKATEFIGQSSGKSLKGQSQKVQQAVLEKFRAGGYNVIVATSIGEEGLDIMEVDLVICFDANISSLRMIQRMGRTGRKNNGRVVVLACEGSELKGYLRKQSSSKTVRKHMRSGGLKSFNFHSSPRMIPHIFKPEAKLVELSIEQFVPRTKKVKDNHPIQTPKVVEKLTDSEAELIAKYFEPNVNSTWRPSLIAFPHFQAFPSRVHKVMHSLRTRILIDSMQHLQGISVSRGVKTLVEDQGLSNHCLEVEAQGNEREGSPCRNESLKQLLEKGISDSEVLPTRIANTEDEQKISKFQGPNSPAHCYHFSSQFVSVDSHGKVLITSVPVLQANQISTCKSPGANNMAPLNLNQYFSPETPKLKKDPLEGDSVAETLDEDLSNNLKDTELSPRLTTFIKSGIVPESPIDGFGSPKSKSGNELVAGFVSPEKSINKTAMKPSSSENNGVIVESSACAREASNSSSEINNVAKENIGNDRGCNSPIAEETRTPANSEHHSCSKDWCLISRDKIGSVEQPRKLKRLCRYGDTRGRSIRNNMEENSVLPKRNLATSFARPNLFTRRHRRGKQKPDVSIRDFIEVEAEVSSEADVSDDEKVEEENSSYDCSFIDDRTSLTSASTQAEVGSVDMMGIYRRSLLSQSPIVRQPDCFTDISPESVAPMNSTTTTGNFLGKSVPCLRTPHARSKNSSDARNPVSDPHQLYPVSTSSVAMPLSSTHFPEQSYRFDSRKRKMSFSQAGSVPAVNLEKRFLNLLEAEGGESSLKGHTEKIEVNRDAINIESSMKDQGEEIEANGDMYYNDSFYEGIDLDAVEAQATMLLKNKSELSVQRDDMIPESTLHNDVLTGSPSFDLGI